MRIVSLLPSATEIVGLLGAGDSLVGRSHECDHPPGLPAPVLTAARTAWAPESGSGAAAIDRQVREQLESGSSLYTLNVDLLARLQPELIITQDLCSVCSIDLESVRAAAAEVAERTGAAPRVLSLNPQTLEDVLDDVLRVGEAIDRSERAHAEVAKLRDRLWRAQEHVNAYIDGSVVGFLEWSEPLFVAGHWTVQMIERAGGRHPLNPTEAPPSAGAASGFQVAAKRAGPGRQVSAEEFLASGPQRLVIAPCGLTLEQTAEAARQLAAQPWFDDLPAVRFGRVALVDGNQMFNRPGPRLVDAFEWLVGWLQDRPELIPRGFPWRPLEASETDV